MTTDSKHSNGVACRGRGEVWLRGNNVTSGYYKMEKETKAEFDRWAEAVTAGNSRSRRGTTVTDVAATTGGATVGTWPRRNVAAMERGRDRLA